MANQKKAQSGSLKTEVSEGVALVTIDRPHRKNAITQAMWLELAETVTALGKNPETRMIVIMGAGGDFSAGADIGEFDEVRRNAETARFYENANSAAFAAVRDAPVPTLAAIRGICFGGGFGLAAACDLRVAEDDARFCVPAAKLGLAYPVDAMIDIVEALGPQLARYLTYSAASIDAATALSAGFLLEIVERGTLEFRARELARVIAANAPLSVRASKAAIRASLSRDGKAYQLAEALGAATFDSLDYGEGRSAFREKRKPQFHGK
ncbi:enoyl-CoA hydratase-related protein [Aquamicrobium sp. LC103]|uniref:enoyl-CoA hydratase-related protein n=1 Tax=Aquamicrobium sp. LC103 TaxID=1120658 RepID=UPI00063E836E|nr:enoyl-CoA hydratase-related protein [Aquamicrobium sp. LC103]TKT76933.1 enoyl-CoA hydratase [Aquamicrobium sp. LC103]